MTRWSEVAGTDSGPAYDARLEALARTGKGMQGEADFVGGLLRPPARVLDAGCGTGRVGIELRQRGYDVVGVDVERSMLAVARERDPDGVWLLRDLGALDPDDPALEGAFDIVLLAGNVVPLLAEGAEADVVRRLAGCLGADGMLVAGFGLDVDHLPLDHAPVTLNDYDRWCVTARLVLRDRFATWERATCNGPTGYAVSVHARSA
jgi:SAM-dependent methyltransferase